MARLESGQAHRMGETEALNGCFQAFSMQIAPGFYLYRHHLSTQLNKKIKFIGRIIVGPILRIQSGGHQFLTYELLSERTLCSAKHIVSIKNDARFNAAHFPQ